MAAVILQYLCKNGDCIDRSLSSPALGRLPYALPGMCRANRVNRLAPPAAAKLETRTIYRKCPSESDCQLEEAASPHLPSWSTYCKAHKTYGSMRRRLVDFSLVVIASRCNLLVQAIYRSLRRTCNLLSVTHLKPPGPKSLTSMIRGSPGILRLDGKLQTDHISSAVQTARVPGQDAVYQIDTDVHFSEALARLAEAEKPFDGKVFQAID